MSLAYYMDHHVHAAVVRGLRQRHIDVITVHEDSAARWDDERLLERATSLRRVLFSQDDDLLVIAHQWQRKGRHFAGPVYGAQIRLTIGDAIRDLALIAEIMEPEEMASHIEYIPF